MGLVLELRHKSLQGEMSLVIIPEFDVWFRQSTLRQA